ncbi:hypothetical protein [Flavobacterium sp. W20_MBD1_R3]|uniref:hypothetical protein n=1 Tax=Flavobacterium sp. W20_MBD1_R3 TaxID=3240278 RepID=UPI003F92F3A0
MKQINATDTLQEMIVLLQKKQTVELMQLKDQYHYTYESLRPLNIVKNIFTDMTTSAELRGNLINNIVGISTGYLTKKVMLGATHNPIKRILGTLLQFVITNVVTKYSNTPKS